MNYELIRFIEELVMHYKTTDLSMKLEKAMANESPQGALVMIKEAVEQSNTEEISKILLSQSAIIYTYKKAEVERKAKALDELLNMASVATNGP